jgi:hypothetical protein
MGHVEAVLWLLRELQDQGISLYEHRYDYQAFGNFVLSVGRAHARVQFAWDGKESVLAVSTAKMHNVGARPTWTHDANISLPNGEGLFAEIASEALNLLATK